MTQHPQETPNGKSGSEEILGIRITWGSDDLIWCNEGWGGSEIQAKASEEQKLHFKHAVEIIEQIVNEYE